MLRHNQPVMIVCEPGRVMFVTDGIVPCVVEGPQRTRGNPYLVFADCIREHLGVEPGNLRLTVATVSSGNMDRFDSPE